MTLVVLLPGVSGFTRHAQLRVRFIYDDSTVPERWPWGRSAGGWQGQLEQPLLNGLAPLDPATAEEGAYFSTVRLPDRQGRRWAASETPSPEPEPGFCLDSSRITSDTVGLQLDIVEPVEDGVVVPAQGRAQAFLKIQRRVMASPPPHLGAPDDEEQVAATLWLEGYPAAFFSLNAVAARSAPTPRSRFVSAITAWMAAQLGARLDQFTVTVDSAHDEPPERRAEDAPPLPRVAIRFSVTSCSVALGNIETAITALVGNAAAVNAAVAALVGGGLTRTRNVGMGSPPTRQRNRPGITGPPALRRLPVVRSPL